MNYSTKNCSPLGANPVVQRSLDLRLKNSQARYYLKWGSINTLLLAVLMYDLSQTCGPFRRSYWYKAEYAVAVLFALSTVACFGKYFWFLFRRETVCGTDVQKCLLYKTNGKENNSFKTVNPVKKSKRSFELDSDGDEDDTPVINWHSSFEDSYWGNQSTRRSLSPTRTSPQQHQLNTSAFNSSRNASNLSMDSNYMSPYAEVRREDFMTDPRQLRAMMRRAELERSYAEANEAPNMTNMATANSFWNYCNSAAHMLKTTIYQLAPAPIVTKENAQSSIEEFGTLQFKDSNSEVIKRLSTDKLSQYVANLRYWISTTIVQRLVKEINHVNEVFRQRNLVDMQIGAVSLERLRKTAENQQFVQSCAPMLPMLLPFLDTFSNQEYLVHRIKELAQGSCIGDYRWNSGNAHNGQAWGEHLPTDAAILFHLFCVYLDSQLMPLPQGGGRPFHSRYVLIRDEKRSTKDLINSVHNKAHCAIVSTNNLLNPKFNFISEKELHNCVYDRNNLFYVIIQFLIYMRSHQDSALEGVNLGKSGINIMCVIED